MEKRSPSELEVFLVQMFQEADGAGMGTLDPIAMKDVLRNCAFGLTRLQIHSILAEGEYDEEAGGQVQLHEVRAKGGGSHLPHA